MKWYQNLTIRAKLLVAFASVLVIMCAMSVYSVLQMIESNKQFNSTIERANENIVTATSMLRSFMEAQVAAHDVILYDNSAVIEERFNTADAKIAAVQEYMVPLRAVVAAAEPGTYPFTVEQVDLVNEQIQKYRDVFGELCGFARAGNSAAAMGLLNGAFQDAALSIAASLKNGVSAAIAESTNFTTKNSEQTEWDTRVRIGITFGVLVLSIVIAIGTARAIAKPIRKLTASAKELASGTLQISVRSNRRDEIGQLFLSMDEVIRAFSALESEIARVHRLFEGEGDVDVRLDEDKFSGDYKKIAQRVNSLLSSQMGDMFSMLSLMKSYADGDFSATIKQHIGKKQMINQAVDKFNEKIKAARDDTRTLVEACVVGELSARIDASEYQGDWKQMAEGINMLMDSVITPMEESIDVLMEMAAGRLDVSIKGDYQGEYLKVKNAINTTLATMSCYVAEITRVLDAMSREDLDVSLENEYIGDFAPIRRSLDAIIATFNKILGEINSSAEQVAAGAKMISQSSSMLAQGAADQASAVEELTVTLESINKKTATNAENAGNASALATSARQNAEEGNHDMKDMLAAMSDISKASQNISKIVKVIDDIAFQTNLLALNASVEAAHAGQHGKGFTVVAEQVRVLSGRSKDAASETTTLIESTAAKVEQGMRIAQQTAGMLDKIVAQVATISEIAEDVSEASDAQADAIRQVSDGITQISFVTQTNTATSEETAASSEQLESQADTFRRMVSRFKLKNNGVNLPGAADAAGAPKSAGTEPEVRVSAGQSYDKAGFGKY